MLVSLPPLNLMFNSSVEYFQPWCEVLLREHAKHYRGEYEAPHTDQTLLKIGGALLYKYAYHV